MSTKYVTQIRTAVSSATYTLNESVPIDLRTIDGLELGGIMVIGIRLQT